MKEKSESENPSDQTDQSLLFLGISELNYRFQSFSVKNFYRIEYKILYCTPHDLTKEILTTCYNGWTYLFLVFLIILYFCITLNFLIEKVVIWNESHFGVFSSFRPAIYLFLFDYHILCLLEGGSNIHEVIHKRVMLSKQVDNIDMIVWQFFYVQFASQWHYTRKYFWVFNPKIVN